MREKALGVQARLTSVGNEVVVLVMVGGVKDRYGEPERGE
jgi:hypothetical protein